MEIVADSMDDLPVELPRIDASGIVCGKQRRGLGYDPVLDFEVEIDVDASRLGNSAILANWIVRVQSIRFGCKCK